MTAVSKCREYRKEVCRILGTKNRQAIARFMKQARQHTVRHSAECAYRIYYKGIGRFSHAVRV